MWKTIPLWQILAITLIVQIFQQTSGEPVKNPRAAAGNRTVDDLTTEFAKELMRRSKSADISAALNTKVDPCDNFYQYACGNWHRGNPAQLLKNIMTDKFQMIAKAFDRRLERVLKESGLLGNELENKVKSFYQACQLVKRDDLQYKLALENVYKEFGELPVLSASPDDWDDENFSWWQTIAKIQHKYGKQIILAVDILGDILNNTENRVYLGPPDFSMGTHTKFLSVLQESSTVRDLEQYFGVENSLAKRTAKEMIDLERELVHGGTDARLGVGLKDMLSLKQVAELTTNFSDSLDMSQYLELVLGSPQIPESVYLYDEKYLANIFKVIAGKPKRVLANYILWQLLQDYLINIEAGSRLPKWCLDKTKQYFNKYLDHLVYQRYRNENAEKEVHQVWQEIRETFRDELKGDKLDWIANATREHAIEKLDNMQLEINSYETENFTETYGSLQVNRFNYVENVQHILMQDNKKNLARLNQSATALESPKVLSFTPAYNILENNIKIPVALLQPRFFWDVNYPQALRYASLGYLIAHEMVHGFDDDGRNYDKQGNYHNWWDSKSTYEFEARRKCFQAQYHNYKYGGRNLPESVSQSENIADNAGIKLAYKAYMRWLNTQKATDADIERKESLPGLAFDNRQLFFVSFAQVWCEDVQTLFKSSLASADTHAPGMYRVIGSLSNFQEFSWIFKCRPDAPMDPEFKCAIY